MATACLGQDFAPPPAPSVYGPGPGFFRPRRTSSPAPALDFYLHLIRRRAAGPGFSPPLTSRPFAGPGFLTPLNQPLGPAAVSQPGSWPPPPLSPGRTQSPITGGRALFPETATTLGIGDMMGFGGRGGMGGFGGGMLPSNSVRYSVIWFPTVPVQGQATDLEMVEGKSLVHPSAVEGFAKRLEHFRRRPKRAFRDRGHPPGHGPTVALTALGINLGLRYNRQLDNGWIAGGGVSIGSASDHPFAGIHEIYVGLNAMLRIPQGEHNAWIFTLMYSPIDELTSRCRGSPLAGIPRRSFMPTSVFP